MKSTHRISNITNGIITLDNQRKYKADAFGSSKLSFWSAHFDKVEVEGSGVFTKITNPKRKETINAAETH